MVLQEKGRAQPSRNELSIPGQEEVSRQEDKVYQSISYTLGGAKAIIKSPVL